MYSFVFLTCDDLRAGMDRAFRSWSANHPYVRFHDVTQRCNDTLGGWEYDPVGRTVPCENAELWITSAPNASGSDLAAYELSTYNWTRNFRKANGQRSYDLGVYQTVHASIAFNTGICWYLDSTFCAPFHAFKQQLGPVAALNVARMIIFSLWTLAVLETVLVTVMWLRVQLEMLRLEIVGFLDTDGDGEVELHEVLGMLKFVCCCGRKPKKAQQESLDPEKEEKVAGFLLSEESASEWHLQYELASKIKPCRLTLRLVGLIVPILFYSTIMIPCWDCFDFEAAATHEIGHALGLHHPDYAASIGRNMALETTWQHTCDMTIVGSRWWEHGNVWEHVRVEPTPPGRAIMNMFTQNPTAVCLEQDDLDGLNVLYPTCADTVTVPQCYKTQQYLGWVRFLVVVGFPLLVIFLGVLGCHTATMYAHERNRAQLRGKHAGLASDVEQKILERRTQLKKAKQGRRVMNAVQGIKQAHGMLVTQRQEEERLNVGCFSDSSAHTPTGRDGPTPPVRSASRDAERLRAYSKALVTSSSSAALHEDGGSRSHTPASVQLETFGPAAPRAPPLPPISQPGSMPMRMSHPSSSRVSPTPLYAAYPTGAMPPPNVADGANGGFALQASRLPPSPPQVKQRAGEMQPRRLAPLMTDAPAR